jgi:hypothetical protein
VRVNTWRCNTVIRLGLNIADYRDDGPRSAFERLAHLVRAGEAAGFDSFFAGDHLMSDKAAPGGRWLELYTTLSALAARTSYIKLGALVGAVLFRNPALLAKTVTSLDVISNGRAIFGIGSGATKVSITPTDTASRRRPIAFTSSRRLSSSWPPCSVAPPPLSRAGGYEPRQPSTCRRRSPREARR